MKAEILRGVTEKETAGGWSGNLLVSPRFHRWHHVDLPEAYDKNFASIFPFFDLAFGTYHDPEPSVDKPTGFEGGPGNDVIKLLTYPFTAWIAMAHTYRKARAERG